MRIEGQGPGRVWVDGFGRLALRCAQALLVALAVAGALWVLVALRLVVVPVVVATMLAAAAWPLVTFLRRQGFPAALAALTTLVLGLALLTGLGWIVVHGVRREWDQLWQGVSDGLVEVETWLISGPLDFTASQLEEARSAITEMLAGDDFRSGAIAGASLVVEVVAGIFLTVVVLFFFLKDGPRIWDFLSGLAPEDQQARAARVGTRSASVLGAYVRGTTIVALVDAVLIGIALLVLGVPLALPLAVVVFLGAYIPLAGATVAGAVAALVALATEGLTSALIVVAVVVAVNQIEGDVLAPVVLGAALSIHPLAVLLALSSGFIVAGVIGALLAVPLVAVAWTMVSAWNEQDALPEPGGP